MACFAPEPRGRGVAIYTLGCKLNQLESESIAGAFHEKGFEVIPWLDSDKAGEGGTGPDQEPPFLVIINTCTVTSKSEQKARRIIRKALREYSEPLVIVTGCYAQMEARLLESLEQDDPASGPSSFYAESKRLFVISGDQKNRILDLPAALSGKDFASLKASAAAWACGVVRSGEGPGGNPAELSLENSPDFSMDPCFRFEPGRFIFHSRAFLKIQDGCDNRCAYCRVSLARGKSRSLSPARVLSALRALEEKGYTEAVLTGVNICQYCGEEEGRAFFLPSLLEYLLEGTRNIRLRLSSIEPGILDEAFYRAVSHSRIRPHFHLSLQSASPYILERMRRRYAPEAVLESLDALRSVKDDPFLGCDVITGFPGETSGEFEKTFDFCGKADFAGIHAFPFSRRPGTEAWNYQDRVSEKDAGLRAERLISLARKQRGNYIRRWTGKETEAVVEEYGKPGDAVPLLSANYLRLLALKNNRDLPKAGTSVRCKILGEPFGDTPDKENADSELFPGKRFSRFDVMAEMILL